MIDARANRELAPFLQGGPTWSLFPRYVAQCAPDQRSVVSLDAVGNVRAALVCGASCGNEFVQNAWLVARDGVAAREVIARFAGWPRRPGLSFEPRFASEVVDALPGVVPTTDLHLVLGSVAEEPDPEVEELSPARLAELRTDHEVRRATGPPELLPERGFHGLVIGGELLATADVIVDVGDVCTVQQVFTVERARRRGLARRIVVEVARRMAVRGRVVTYLAAESNEASVRTARSAGFVVRERLGYLPPG